jgi:hypothetical protein
MVWHKVFKIDQSLNMFPKFRAGNMRFENHVWPGNIEKGESMSAFLILLEFIAIYIHVFFEDCIKLTWGQKIVKMKTPGWLNGVLLQIF